MPVPGFDAFDALLPVIGFLGCGCGCGCEDEEEDVIIAKIVKGADGEDEYVEPTDEEFEAVQKAYDALVEESEQE